MGIYRAIRGITALFFLFITECYRRIFESMSGITTTGSTILTSIEAASKGVLIWRALLQWLGGVGIIVMALAVLPMLSVGGMQLFKTESFDTAEKVIPRAAQLCAVFLRFIRGLPFCGPLC